MTQYQEYSSPGAPKIDSPQSQPIIGVQLSEPSAILNAINNPPDQFTIEASLGTTQVHDEVVTTLSNKVEFLSKSNPTVRTKIELSPTRNTVENNLGFLNEEKVTQIESALQKKYPEAYVHISPTNNRRVFIPLGEDSMLGSVEVNLGFPNRETANKVQEMLIDMYKTSSNKNTVTLMQREIESGLFPKPIDVEAYLPTSDPVAFDATLRAYTQACADFLEALYQTEGKAPHELTMKLQLAGRSEPEAPAVNKDILPAPAERAPQSPEAYSETLIQDFATFIKEEFAYIGYLSPSRTRDHFYRHYCVGSTQKEQARAETTNENIREKLLTACRAAERQILGHASQSFAFTDREGVNGYFLAGRDGGSMYNFPNGENVGRVYLHPDITAAPEIFAQLAARLYDAKIRFQMKILEEPSIGTHVTRTDKMVVYFLDSDQDALLPLLEDFHLTYGAQLRSDKPRFAAVVSNHEGTPMKGIHFMQDPSESEQISANKVRANIMYEYYRRNGESDVAPPNLQLFRQICEQNGINPDHLAFNKNSHNFATLQARCTTY